MLRPLTDAEIYKDAAADIEFQLYRLTSEKRDKLLLELIAEFMPYDKVMSKFKAGKLHSGSKKGKKVKSRKQAIAIMLSEKRAAKGGKKEYAASKQRRDGGNQYT